MRKEEFVFEGSGGAKLPAVLWLPDGEATHILQIVHGMTEHIGRYDAFARQMTACGIAVAGYDLRGHGRNPGSTVVASFGENGWEASLQDMQLFFEYLDKCFENLEHDLLGFSLGSFLLREYLGSYERVPEVTEQTDAVIGDLEDIENWHPQGESMSCAVTVQEMIAEQLLDREFSEDAVIDFAEQAGWYDPVEGTTLEDAGKVLEAMGLDVERDYSATLSDLEQALENGEKILCGVDNMILYNPLFALIPGRAANHAVQLVAIDYTDPENPQVILNDTGVPNGQGIRHDLDVFMAAWKTSGNYAMFAGKGDAA